MSRYSALLVAFVATLLVLLAVGASAAVPRCDEDGASVTSSSTPAVMKGALSYNGVSGCARGEKASFTIVERDAATAAIAKMNDWKYVVVVRGAEPARFTLDATCNDVVVCEASLTFTAESL